MVKMGAFGETVGITPVLLHKGVIGFGQRVHTNQVSFVLGNSEQGQTPCGGQDLSARHGGGVQRKRGGSGHCFSAPEQGFTPAQLLTYVKFRFLSCPPGWCNIYRGCRTM